MIHLAIRKRPPAGEIPELGRWYIGIEIYQYPPTMYLRGFLFKPSVRIYCVKFKSFGEPFKIYGREEEKLGFIRRWDCPFGFVIESV